MLTFNNDDEFHKHFITELCEKCDEKPYIICDGSGPTPRVSHINPEVAYRISQLHSNPYLKPYKYGSKMREVGILNGIGKEDAFVSLTDKQSLDIRKEFKEKGNHFVIPNFILNKQYPILKKRTDLIRMFIRFSPEKNLKDAIKVFEKVVEKRENAILEIFGRVGVVPGEKNEYKMIKNMIKDLNLEKNVFLKDFVIDTNSKMAESTATILTSNFEGFPLVILESMVNSTPVISYDINYGPGDMIDHGVNGFLVKYGNIEQMAEYIIELLDDTEKAKKMGILARKKVLENYSSDVILKKWEDLFEKISTS